MKLTSIRMARVPAGMAPVGRAGLLAGDAAEDGVSGHASFAMLKPKAGDHFGRGFGSCRQRKDQAAKRQCEVQQQTRMVFDRSPGHPLQCTALGKRHMLLSLLKTGFNYRFGIVRSCRYRRRRATPEWQNVGGHIGEFRDKFDSMPGKAGATGPGVGMHQIPPN